MRRARPPPTTTNRAVARARAQIRHPETQIHAPVAVSTDRQTELSTAEAVDDPREGVSKILESSTLAVIARCPFRAAAPPTPATSASHVLLADVAMPVHDRNVLVQLVLLALHRSHISCAGAPAY